MGLDVYTYRQPKPMASIKAHKNYDDQSTVLWNEICGDGKYEEVPETKKEEYRQKSDMLRSSLGIDEHWDFRGDTKLALPSKKYPEHIFQIGYFRSSYNGSGTNSILRQYTGRDLYWIFENATDLDDDGYIRRPDWADAKERAKELLKDFKKEIQSTAGFKTVEVNDIRFNEDELPDENEVLKKFLEERKTWEKSKNSFDNYSNRGGSFFMKEPLEVYAVMPTKGFGKPTTLIVKDDGTWPEHYIQALEVVIETCNYILATKEPENYTTHWSG